MITELLKNINYIREKRDIVKSNEEVEDIMKIVGLNCEVLSEFPEFLRPYCKEKGLRIWQYPCQFAPYILFIKKLGININNYLEIGSRWGGTFIFTVEFLNITNSLAVDPIKIPLSLLEYKKYNKNYDYLSAKSESPIFLNKIQEFKPDMVLIDGDHSYKAMMNDFKICHKNNVKIIVCHDICSESCQESTECWEDIRENFKNDYDFYEFTENYVPDVKYPFLGIGVCIKK